MSQKHLILEFRIHYKVSKMKFFVEKLEKYSCLSAYVPDKLRTLHYLTFVSDFSSFKTQIKANF